MKRPALAALGGFALAVILITGCHGSSSSSVASGAASSAHSAAAAIASSTPGQKIKADASHCIPKDALGQVQLLNQLRKDTKAHPNGAWAALAKCMGLTPADKQAFEDQALTAAEHATPSLTTSAGRHNYLYNTIPAIAAGLAAPAPSPSAS